MEAKTIQHVIDRAIANEEDAYAFYTGLASLVQDKEAKDTLQFLAEQEKKHKAFLVGYREGRYAMNALGMDEVVDYHIAQHLEAPDIVKDMQSRDVYLVAAHREMNSYQFYKGLAEIQPAGELKDILLRLAAEELKHKEKVEYLYANTAFPQTQGG